MFRLKLIFDKQEEIWFELETKFSCVFVQMPSAHIQARGPWTLPIDAFCSHRLTVIFPCNPCSACCWSSCVVQKECIIIWSPCWLSRGRATKPYKAIAFSMRDYRRHGPKQKRRQLVSKANLMGLGGTEKGCSSSPICHENRADLALFLSN